MVWSISPKLIFIVIVFDGGPPFQLNVAIYPPTIFEAPRSREELEVEISTVIFREVLTSQLKNSLPATWGTITMSKYSSLSQFAGHDTKA